MNILFVCTGNTCRSPMAGGLMEKAIKDCDNKDVHVSTAGLSVYASGKASENAITVMEKMGIDISGHESSQITKTDIEDADIVLCMTNTHRNVLVDLYPEFADKIYTLCEYAYGTYDDITDPYGGDEQEYTECAMQLKDAVAAVCKKLEL